MKKYLSFIAFAMLAVFSLSFVSCSSDDDESEPTENSSDIIGTWYDDYDNDDDFSYIQFKSDGTFIDVESSEDAEKGYWVQRGKWSISGDKLMMKVTSSDDPFDIWVGTTLTYDIIKIEKNKLTMSLWGITGTLVRVSDDAIQKYL